MIQEFLHPAKDFVAGDGVVAELVGERRECTRRSCSVDEGSSLVHHVFTDTAMHDRTGVTMKLP